MDDSNPAVALAALRATEAFLAPLAQNREEAEGRMQGLSWLDYQVCVTFVKDVGICVKSGLMLACSVFPFSA